MSNELIARRSLLKAAMLGAVTVSVATLHSEAQAQTLTPLSLTDPQATALSYAEDASKVTNPNHQAGQMCSTCIQYLGKGSDPRGGCNIYPGKSVNARGWCVVWAKKNT
jgi:hypothetical protein